MLDYCEKDSRMTKVYGEGELTLQKTERGWLLVSRFDKEVGEFEVILPVDPFVSPVTEDMLIGAKPLYRECLIINVDDLIWSFIDEMKGWVKCSQNKFALEYRVNFAEKFFNLFEHMDINEVTNCRVGGF